MKSISIYKDKGGNFHAVNTPHVVDFDFRECPEGQVEVIFASGGKEVMQYKEVSAPKEPKKEKK